ncbi:hypothetical protein [Pseudonocardia sp. WMMC193]|uniref:hypothetical protein n=1 Tax=Pseudonocardia sp. WMMC193 TaxID=2911965 RepID=UPI001F2D5D0C|nr:hypothetical protein [Pseudonocardia sp. WMMC193]MCF7552713.1 hypothetical protein [Pseudonocardia sp. WMMC193]
MPRSLPHGPGAAAPGIRRGAVAFGALVTVVAAIGMDLLAGEHPLHAATLGVVAAAVAAIRVRLAGRHSGVLALLSGALVAQPALHAATALLPADTHAAETSLSLLHVAVTAAIVAMVTGAQALFLVLALPFVWMVLLMPSGPVESCPQLPPTPHPRRLGVSRIHSAAVFRRGPPEWVAVPS